MKGRKGLGSFDAAGLKGKGDGVRKDARPFAPAEEW